MSDDYLVQRDRIIEQYSLDDSIKELTEDQLNDMIECIIKKENDLSDTINGIKNNKWQIFYWRLQRHLIELVEDFPHIPSHRVIAKGDLKFDCKICCFILIDEASYYDYTPNDLNKVKHYQTESFF